MPIRGTTRSLRVNLRCKCVRIWQAKRFRGASQRTCREEVSEQSSHEEAHWENSHQKSAHLQSFLCRKPCHDLRVFRQCDDSGEHRLLIDKQKAIGSASRAASEKAEKSVKSSHIFSLIHSSSHYQKCARPLRL